MIAFQLIPALLQRELDKKVFIKSIRVIPDNNETVRVEVLLKGKLKKTFNLVGDITQESIKDIANKITQ